MLAFPSNCLSWKFLRIDPRASSHTNKHNVYSFFIYIYRGIKSKLAMSAAEENKDIFKHRFCLLVL